MKFHQLTSEQRYTISVLLQKEMSKKAIAEAIGVHRKMHSQTWEDKKTVKIGFPKLGKYEKRKKMAIPTLGNMKNEKNGHPNIGKHEKQRKSAFLRLGKPKNAAGCISHPSEEWKMLKTAHRS